MPINYVWGDELDINITGHNHTALAPRVFSRASELCTNNKADIFIQNFMGSLHKHFYRV